MEYLATKENINIALLAMLGDEKLVEGWWYSPNKAFGGINPADVWNYDPQGIAIYVFSHLQR